MIDFTNLQEIRVREVQRIMAMSLSEMGDQVMALLEMRDRHLHDARGAPMTFLCWHCHGDLVWGGDNECDSEDYQMESNFTCANCGAFVMLYLPVSPGPSELSKELSKPDAVERELSERITKNDRRIQQLFIRVNSQDKKLERKRR